MTTKAEKVRVILRRDLGKKTDEVILTAVVKMSGFSRGLAKAYITNNTKKVLAERKAGKKKVAKKSGTSKRAKAATKKRPSKPVKRRTAKKS